MALSNGSLVVLLLLHRFAKKQGRLFAQFHFVIIVQLYFDMPRGGDVPDGGQVG